MASGNPIYSLLWLVLLIFIAWPLAGFAAGFYILLQVRKYTDMDSINSFISNMKQVLTNHQPFESLFSIVKDLNTFLERFVTWPRECGKAIVNCKTSFPQP
jgi:hypothetical protein